MYLVGVLPVMSLCLACALLAAVSQTLAAERAYGALKHMTPLCVWVRHGSVGLWWNANVTPRAAAWLSPRYNAVCVALPWVSSLPTSGRPSLQVVP